MVYAIQDKKEMIYEKENNFAEYNGLGDRPAAIVFPGNYL
jgi:hypothetical protein